MNNREVVANEPLLIAVSSLFIGVGAACAWAGLVLVALEHVGKKGKK